MRARSTPVAVCLTLVGLGALPCAAAAAGRIPVIYSTDLFQPPDDPDDHVDLATLFALDEFDILGIIIEHGEKQASRPGLIPVRQMMQLTGRQVPCVVGLNPPLKSPEDPALDQPAEHQQGVQLLLDKLKAADRQVTIFTTGSMRDVAAAYNRDPDLLRQKVARLYMNIGNASPAESEWNVDLDVHAYVRIMQSDLPVYWCPCFGSPYGTFWKFQQADVFETAPAGLQNFFLYALTSGSDWKATPPPDTSDPLAYLKRDVDPAARRAVYALERNMWCTAPFLHAAGRLVVERAPGIWEAVSAGENAQGVVTPFDFVPGRISIDDRGRTAFQEGGQLGDGHTIAAFKVLNPDRYQAILTSCLRELLRARADEPHAAPDEPLQLRADNLILLPQSQPVLSVQVRNASAAPCAGQITVGAPAGWQLAPAVHEVTLASGEQQRLAFSVTGATETPANEYPLELVAVTPGARVAHRQQIQVATAPYLKPTVDGDPSDWNEAVPVSFTTGGRRTTISTCWNRAGFSLLVAVEENALTRAGQQACFDAVQLALTPRNQTAHWDTLDTARRFEYLLVPGSAVEGTCYRLAGPDTPMSQVEQERPLESLVADAARLAVARQGEITYYECTIPWGDMRQSMQPAEGREFYLSVLVHDPDGTGIRDWGEAAGLWPTQRHWRAWCKWVGAQWADTPPMDCRTPWGLCSSRF